MKIGRFASIAMTSINVSYLLRGKSSKNLPGFSQNKNKCGEFKTGKTKTNQTYSCPRENKYIKNIYD